jgi:hypothetical protein
VQLREHLVSPPLRGWTLHRPTGVAATDLYGVARLVLMDGVQGELEPQAEPTAWRTSAMLSLLWTSRRPGLRVRAEGSAPAASLDK